MLGSFLVLLEWLQPVRKGVSARFRRMPAERLPLVQTAALARSSAGFSSVLSARASRSACRNSPLSSKLNLASMAMTDVGYRMSDVGCWEGDAVVLATTSGLISAIEGPSPTRDVSHLPGRRPTLADHLAERWRGVVCVDAAGRTATLDEDVVRPWGPWAWRWGPWVFFGGPELVAKVRAALPG